MTSFAAGAQRTSDEIDQMIDEGKLTVFPFEVDEQSLSIHF